MPSPSLIILGIRPAPYAIYFCLRRGEYILGTIWTLVGLVPGAGQVADYVVLLTNNISALSISITEYSNNVRCRSL